MNGEQIVRSASNVDFIDFTAPRTCPDRLGAVPKLLESDSRLSQGFHGLARCLVTRRMCAMVIQAAALSMDFSQSFDRRRHRPSQAKVGSTTQRRGRTSKPPAASERLTVSTVQRPMAFQGIAQLWPGIAAIGKNMALATLDPLTRVIADNPATFRGFHALGFSRSGCR